ncbi:hypothetical protein GDO86_008920, partial [Hymenochirus boettgeri]
GANSFGQLGLGDTSDSFLPQQVIGFPDQQVIKAISGGGGHTVATTVSGEIYVCGQNSDGQLGLNHTCDVTHFTLCTAIVNLHVSKVACGWNFTIILTNNGELLSCGSNNFSQLGRSGEGSSSVPRPVDVCKKIVVDVAAGLRHALAITDDRRLFQWGTGIASHAKRFVQKNSVPVIFTAKEPSPVQDTGELYVWGRNQHGQLLHQDLFVLQPWKVGDHFFLGEKIRAVWSGWSHLLAKTESGKLFSGEEELLSAWPSLEIGRGSNRRHEWASQRGSNTGPDSLLNQLLPGGLWIGAQSSNKRRFVIFLGME